MARRPLPCKSELRRGDLDLYNRQRREFDLLNTSCLAGMCPNCRYVNPMRPDLPIDAAELVDAGDVQTQKKYNGDRILVNKYIYTVSDPAAVGRRRVQVSRQRADQLHQAASGPAGRDDSRIPRRLVHGDEAGPGRR